MLGVKNVDITFSSIVSENVNRDVMRIVRYNVIVLSHGFIAFSHIATKQPVLNNKELLNG